MLSITLPVGSEHLVLDKALMYPCVSTFLTSFYTLQYSRAEAILQLPESKEDAHKTQVSPISDIWVLYNIAHYGIEHEKTKMVDLVRPSSEQPISLLNNNAANIDSKPSSV